MRSPILFAAFVGLVLLTALFAFRNGNNGATPVTKGTVTLVGDSLNAGVERYLPSALPGWKIVANDRVGRTTAQGIAEIEARRPALASHVVVSLGTNDPPEAVASFRRDVARLLALTGPNRCVVWATIWRDNAPNDAFNAVLREAAGANRRLRLIEWAAMIEQHPEWLAHDGLHGNETGYRERAVAVAAETTGCAPARTVGE